MWSAFVVSLQLKIKDFLKVVLFGFITAHIDIFFTLGPSVLPSEKSFAQVILFKIITFLKNMIINTLNTCCSYYVFIFRGVLTRGLNIFLSSKRLFILGQLYPINVKTAERIKLKVVVVPDHPVSDYRNGLCPVRIQREKILKWNRQNKHDQLGLTELFGLCF